jgi:hypothetical protein
MSVIGQRSSREGHRRIVQIAIESQLPADPQRRFPCRALPRMV